MCVAGIVSTLIAEPVSFWNMVKRWVKAVCVVWRIASVAEKKLVLILLSSADGTWLVDLLLLLLFLDPSQRIEISNLLLVFDFVFGDYWTCIRS